VLEEFGRFNERDINETDKKRLMQRRTDCVANVGEIVEKKIISTL